MLVSPFVVREMASQLRCRDGRRGCGVIRVLISVTAAAMR
jgi:hypothetical protein